MREIEMKLSHFLLQFKRAAKNCASLKKELTTVYSSYIYIILIWFFANIFLYSNKVNHPMELHLVHFNSLYGSNLSEAMNTSTAYDTIAVLSVIFEIQKEDNPDMNPITDGTVGAALWDHG